jgi:hypothetical protein
MWTQAEGGNKALVSLSLLTAHSKIPVFAAKVQELTGRSWNSAATIAWNLE